jgi:DNA-binding HxlR family transcriptional regulator
MTAETESRQEAIETHNASACPVVNAISEIGTPWRLNVIYALQDGEHRFNELKRATDARSKTLSEALDELVDAGIVSRRMEEDAPVAVYYGLSEKGRDLSGVLAEFDAWAQRWGEPVPDGPNGRLREE